MKYKLFLIRHAQAESNAQKTVSGYIDDSLTPLGLAQARALADYIKLNKLNKPQRVYVSTMRRAIQTANEIGFQVESEYSPELNETNCGSVTTWPRSLFDTTYLDFWTSFDPQRRFPGGESHTEMSTRVVRKFHSIWKTGTDGTYDVVVGHAGMISAILHNVFDVPLHLFTRFITSNASISCLEAGNDSKLPNLILFNQVPESVSKISQ